MNAPYDEREVASLMLNQNLSREHAVGESIFQSASRALDGALQVRHGNIRAAVRDYLVVGRPAITSALGALARNY